ncbi:hypothetical protein C1645_772208 [Glomus cerebriforme]|uniref:Uncharacterized protein n=1 Tax=Glomus cerebriforme TaxID=658196 RepID=A0A397S994_9GLOM|nr:hypothetical protein C1645_790547 [Glomus cerebriforme]RIA89528.1 hypothetical protein C1645_772208 [Glomus cerebriforme]
MPPVENKRTTPQDQRWTPSELVKVLDYINNNFEIWANNHYNTCVKVIEATHSTRDATSICNKVESMIKAMEEGKRSTKSEKIQGLVKQIYEKTKGIEGGEKKRKKQKNQEIVNRTNDTDIDMISNVDEVIERVLPFSTEAVENLYNEKIQQIEHSRSNLLDMVVKTNDELMRFNVPIPSSIEMINNSFSIKTQHINQLRSELIKIIEDINKNYEKMSDLLV